MLNWIFLALILSSVVSAAFLGTMHEVSASTATSAKTAVDIALGLVGQMALWLGLMRILEEGGLLRSLSRRLAPLMRRLFPDVPSDHPAMAAMILNLAANMVGLTNAATPFGLRAMIELDKLNRRKGVATDAMCLFLAINTSGVAVLPLGVIAVRASLGAKNLTGIVLPTVLATACSTIAAVIATKIFQRFSIFAPERYAPADAPSLGETSPVKGIAEAEAKAQIEAPPATPLQRGLVTAVLVALLVGLVRQTATGEGADLFAAVKHLLEDWLLPILITGILLFGFARRVKVYEVVVQGAKEGFNVAVTIIPFMVAILVAIGMFRASGAMDVLVRMLAPVTEAIGFPAEALPMALIRPLSGSGALAVMTELMKTHGPDSFIGFFVSVLNGSFETTFYVLAVYFGSVGVRATRHTVLACLASDLTGVTAALVLSKLFY